MEPYCQINEGVKEADSLDGYQTNGEDDNPTLGADPVKVRPGRSKIEQAKIYQ